MAFAFEDIIDSYELPDGLYQAYIRFEEAMFHAQRKSLLNSKRKYKVLQKQKILTSEQLRKKMTSLPEDARAEEIGKYYMGFDAWLANGVLEQQRERALQLRSEPSEELLQKARHLFGDEIL